MTNLIFDLNRDTLRAALTKELNTRDIKDVKVLLNS